MSTWKSFRTEGTPHPFALALANENTLLISGLGGHDADGNIDESAEAQTRQGLETMRSHLAREGMSLDEIVWIHPYVTDLSYAQEMDKVFAEVFGDAPPACGAMIAGVTLADPRMKVEFEAVAVKGAQRVRA